MDNNTMWRMRDHITANERSVPHPYKDNKGKLTVGTGCLVDDEKSFVAMPFQITDPKTGELRPATEAEKKAEFQRAKGLSDTELQSDSAKHATARLGPAKVDEAFALGRFNTFARQAQKSGNADGLEQKAHSIFGPLFRDPKDDKAPKVEGGVFQETLNGIGGRRYDDWQPLKVDNWIGPKTTAAFGRILQDEDADSVTSAFGRGLGLL